jgi:RNA polymerase sigma factor for flagellar operon FliA
VARNVHQASLRYQQAAMGSSQESELIEENLPLVRHIVGRLALSLPSHIDVDDLNSAGLVGLLNAVRQFDPTAGSSFASYARVRIRGEIFDQLRRMDWVPRSVHEKARKIEAVIAELETAKGEPPTEGEVAAALGLSTTAYLRMLDEIRPATFVCLDAVMNSEDDPDRTHHEVVADRKSNV